MLRLTKKADYGLMALKLLAEQGPGAAMSAKDIADTYHLPLQLLAKVLQQLTKSGMLESHAGTHGGYSLARSADEINAFEVIRAIDGPFFITSCATVKGACVLHDHCTVKEPLQRLNDAFRDVLVDVRISDLAQDPPRNPQVAAARELVQLI
jgi:Rrf2 family protein